MSVSLSNLLGQGPLVRAYLGSNQVITNSAITQLNINTVDYDTNSNFSISTHLFTPTIAGYYQINAAATFVFSAAAGSTSILYIRKNGGTIEYSEYNIGSSNMQNVSNTVSTLIYMNGTSDSIDLAVYATSSSGANTVSAGDNNSNFTAFLARLP